MFLSCQSLATTLLSVSWEFDYGYFFFSRILFFNLERGCACEWRGGAEGKKEEKKKAQARQIESKQ